jgi:hypothetical protein
MLIFKNAAIGHIFCLTILLLSSQTVIAPSSVCAKSGTIYLKNGGLVNGDVMEVMPNQYATIKLADGTVRKVEWGEIDRVDTGSTPAPEQAPTQPPVQPAPQPAPQPAVTPMPAPVAPAVPTPTIRYEERTSHGVPAVFIPGFVTLGVSWGVTIVVGIEVSAHNDPNYSDDSSSDFYDSSDGGTPKGIDVAASLIPLVGPWIGLGSGESRVPDAVWVVSGVTQMVGLTLGVVGLALKRTRRVPVYSYGAAESTKETTAYLTPLVMGRGGAGLGLRVVNY